MACWWLDAHPNTEPKPLFLQIGFPGPHPPYDPVMRYAEPYLEKELPLYDVSQEELENQPPPFQELRDHNSKIDHDSVIMPSATDTGTTTSSACLLLCQRHYD